MHHLRHHLNYQTQLRVLHQPPVLHQYPSADLVLSQLHLHPYQTSLSSSISPCLYYRLCLFLCFNRLLRLRIPTNRISANNIHITSKKHTSIKTLATPTVNLRIAKRSTLLLFSNMMLPSYLFTYTLSPITILCSDCCYFIQNLLKNTLGSKYPNVSLLLQCIPSNIIIAKFISQLFTIALLINCLLLLIILTPHPIHIF